MKMNEVATGITMTISDHRLQHVPLKQLRPDLELNNNQSVEGVCSVKDNLLQMRKKHNHHSSSASASGSDISIDEDIEQEINKAEQEEIVGEQDSAKDGEVQCENCENFTILTTKEKTIEDGTKRIRSMSDGSPNMHGYPDAQPFEVFPSLPDSVLEKLELIGHHGKSHKERMHEDELEQKFVSLSLAFTIDATTIEHRCDRQRRCRDQTETNLNTELERLVEKAHRLKPLCVDAETTELLTGLLSQVDVIIHAAEHAAIAAERYGAVQHEARLADSAQLMINHVHALKQQRDFARRQLSYTKKVLQDTSQSTISNVHKHGLRHGSHGNVGLHGVGNSDAKLITKRRASIATLTHQDIFNHGEGKGLEVKKITRRTSEMTIRSGNVLHRNTRTPRLELGLDLVKIRENTVENHLGKRASLPEEPEEDPTDIEESQDVPCTYQEEARRSSCYSEKHPTLEEEINEVEFISDKTVQKIGIGTSQLKFKVIYSLRKLSRYFGNSLTTWLDEGAQGSFFYFCALLCFTLSIISLGNVLVELEAERGGTFLHWLYNA